nr:hypothetical protein CFP56_30684 [Quercus suber]
MKRVLGALDERTQPSSKHPVSVCVDSFKSRFCRERNHRFQAANDEVTSCKRCTPEDVIVTTTATARALTVKWPTSSLSTWTNWFRRSSGEHPDQEADLQMRGPEIRQVRELLLLGE